MRVYKHGRHEYSVTRNKDNTVSVVMLGGYGYRGVLTRDALYDLEEPHSGEVDETWFGKIGMLPEPYYYEPHERGAPQHPKFEVCLKLLCEQIEYMEGTAPSHAAYMGDVAVHIDTLIARCTDERVVLPPLSAKVQEEMERE